MFLTAVELEEGEHLHCSSSQLRVCSIQPAPQHGEQTTRALCVMFLIAQFAAAPRLAVAATSFSSSQHGRKAALRRPACTAPCNVRAELTVALSSTCGHTCVNPWDIGPHITDSSVARVLQLVRHDIFMIWHIFLWLVIRG